MAKNTMRFPIGNVATPRKICSNGFNKITALSPLKGLTNLKQLNLQGNPIPEDQKAMLKKALPDFKITFF